MSKGRKKHGCARHSDYDAEKKKARLYDDIREILKAAGGDGLFEQIPPPGLKFLYRTRFLPIKIVAGRGEDLPASVLSRAKEVLPRALDVASASPFKDGTEIALQVFFSSGIPLHWYLKQLDENGDDAAASLKKRLESFLPLEKILEDLNFRLSFVMLGIGMMTSDLCSCIYWGEFRGMNLKRKHGTGVENYFVMHMAVPEKVRMRMAGGAWRNVIRLVLPLPNGLGLDGYKAEARKFGIEGAGEGANLDVFIQEHAFHRLSERLDCIENGEITIEFFDALGNPKVLWTNAVTMLIEYRCMTIKVGYLVGELTPGGLVIRTFLFLTNDGTPEGRKLSKLWGLAKPDKEYLAIDKLGTFMSLDIKSDERLAALFTEAGCGGLLDLRDKLKDERQSEDSPSLDSMVRYFEGHNSTWRNTAAKKYRNAVR